MNCAKRTRLSWSWRGWQCQPQTLRRRAGDRREFWSELYSTLATECGYTPEEIRSMTLHDVDRITRGWNKAPPPRMLLMAIGAALGIKFQQAKPEKPKYMTADEA